MKFAASITGELIAAGADAPQKALCPSCKGIVILRWRRRSSQPGDITYFWRHTDHDHPRCPARFRHDLIT